MNNIERFKDYCQSHRLVSFLIIIGVIVVALGSFTKALDDIIEFAHKHRPIASTRSPNQSVVVPDERTPPVEVALKPKPAATETLEAKPVLATNADVTAKKGNEEIRAEAVAIKLPEETKVVATEAAKSAPVAPPKPTLKTHEELIAEIREKLARGEQITADEASMHNIELMRNRPEGTTGRTIQTGTTIQIGAIPKPTEGVADTEKIIVTDTTAIVGAAKTRIPKGKEVDHPPGVAIAGNATAPGSETPKAQDSKAISQRFGDLNIVFESLRALDKQTILMNLIFQNKGDKNAIGVGVCREASPQEMGLGGFITTGPPPIPLRSTLLGADGLQFESDGANLVGIRPIRSDPKDLIEIPPGEEIKTSFKYRTRDRSSAVSLSFRLQAEIVVNSNLLNRGEGGHNYVFNTGGGGAQAYQPPRELPGDCKIHNLVLDIPVRGK